MSYDLKTGGKIRRGGNRSLIFFVFTIFYTLSFIMLPFTFDRQAAHVAPQTVIAKDSDSDHGGGDSENSGENDGGNSGESGDDDGGNGSSDDSNGGEANEDDGGSDVGGDHEDNSDKDLDDANKFDLDKDDGGRDRHSENENHRGNRRDDGRFDFGALDDLEPMTAQEEADVVGNWDQ